MNNKPLIVRITLILTIVILLALGFGVGYFFKAQKTVSQIEKLGKMENVLKLIGSEKLISAIAVFGEVTNINVSDRTIVLSYNDESAPIKIKDKAVINYLSSGAGGINTPKTVEFSALKIGDQINARVKMLPDGWLEADTLFIIPAPEKK